MSDIQNLIDAAHEAENKIQTAPTQEEREQYQRIAAARWDAVIAAESVDTTFDPTVTKGQG